jgi:hypothetical protein
MIEEFYFPRGLGWGYGKCFVCGETTQIMDDMAAFVESKAGERIVAMFRPDQARLDYREYEPNWVQVKICACKRHKESLQLLYDLTREKRIISKDIVIFVLCSAD